MKLVNPFRKVYSPKQIKTFSFFGKVSLFQGLEYDEIEDLMPHFNLRKYTKNEVVFFRDDPSQAVYVIKEGIIEINLDVYDSFEVLTYTHKFTAFGSNGLLAEARRLFNAICFSDTAELYVIPRVNLESVFDRHPRIQSKLMANLAAMYDHEMSHLIKSYRENVGFFNLSRPFGNAFPLDEH